MVRVQLLLHAVKHSLDGEEERGEEGREGGVRRCSVTPSDRFSLGTCVCARALVCVRADLSQR